jgi:hypothetical protein
MMRFILKICWVWLAVALLAGAAGAANFSASLDRDTIALGERATLSLVFEDGQPQNDPVISVPGLQTVNTRKDRSYSFVNGQMSSVLTFTYTVVPQRTGKFVIPAITATVGGQRLSGPVLQLTVEKPSPPAATDGGDQIAFLKLSLPSEKLYVGQTVVAQLQIYLRNDVLRASQPQFTGTPMDGFTLGKNGGGSQTQTQIGNHIYNITPISLALTVVKSGALTLGPFTANMTLLLNSPNRNSDPFQQFFNQGEQRPVSLTTETLHITGLPLPLAGQPTNFTGAVGDFTLSSSVGPTNVASGDPVTVRVQISGHGSLDAIALPDQSGLGGFKIFPPTVKTELGGQLGLDGTKTFEEIVTPQNAEVREWPQFSFAFFNPEDGKYHTLTQPAVPLTVKAVSATTLPPLAKNVAPPENQTPADILPLKQNLGTLTHVPAGRDFEPLIAKPVFLAAQTLPVLAFLAALIWRRRTDNLANNPRLRRKLAVAQLMQTGLSELKKHAAENKPDEFFALLFRLLQEQLGERLDCPASAITENVVEEHPVLRGVSPAAQAELRELFQLCNQARYAPVRGVSELNSVAQKFEKTIRELQEVKA